MLFSIYYDQVDATLGYDEALELVKKNMIITKKQKRETIQDKKNRSTIIFTERKETTEAVYLSEAALETTKNIVASDGVFMEVSVVITLFADSLEELNRNTDMLRISAAKFACSVKVLDMFQYEGFCSALPLCKQKVYVSRFLSGERLAQISPIAAIEGNKRGGAFCGLNAINDNLIFYNRKHSIVLSGIISGMENSGKTYQMKREILNAMLTTQDKINVITFGKEYDSYIDSLGGSRTYLIEINPFKMIEGYGLTIPEKEAKVLFIKAFCGNEKEAKLLLKESVDFNSYDSVLQIVNEDKYPQLTAILSAIDINIARLNSKSNRLSLYQVSNKIELLVTMEYLWNKSVEEKKNNSSNWIFIDGIDCLLEKEETIPYLLNYMKNTSSIRNVTTAVIQDTVGVMARSISSSIALEELVTDCGYIKLLNCGPLERKKFTELLNIPNALIPYITNVEPSQGLIVTPASNIAFNDNFLDKGNEFTELFKK